MHFIINKLLILGILANIEARKSKSTKGRVKVREKGMISLHQMKVILHLLVAKKSAVLRRAVFVRKEVRRERKGRRQGQMEVQMVMPTLI